MPFREQVNANLRRVQHMETLSRLVIRSCCDNHQATVASDLEQLRRDLHYVAALDDREQAHFLALADTHHVLVRSLTALRDAACLENEKAIARWAANALALEHCEMKQALRLLGMICDALESNQCKVVVIKSLDHWPDLGSDLDLYTTGDPARVAQVMSQEFTAHPVGRSVGDWLANKWNYHVPELSQLVEIHVQYLGQTGEHKELGSRVLERRRTANLEGREFHVPAPEERIIIATLQRMYRHFYFRLCDMVDIALLLQAGAVDFSELQRASSRAGIWPGVATFLCLVQSYVKSYGGVVSLPDEVLLSAQSQHARVRFRSGFLRVPKAIAARLYGSQVLQAGRRRDLRALLRLPLLPPLAVSALLLYGLTGTDKGVW